MFISFCKVTLRKRIAARLFLRICLWDSMSNHKIYFWNFFIFYPPPKENLDSPRRPGIENFLIFSIQFYVENWVYIFNFSRRSLNMTITHFQEGKILTWKSWDIYRKFNLDTDRLWWWDRQSHISFSFCLSSFHASLQKKILFFTFRLNYVKKIEREESDEWINDEFDFYPGAKSIFLGS